MMKITVQHIIKATRDAIAKRAKVSSSNLKKGTIKKGSVKDLYKDLENG